MSKATGYLLTIVVLAIMAATTPLPVSANSPDTGVKAVNQADDINFDNVPLPLKYAHGSKVLPTFHAIAPSPPLGAKAREHYVKAQILEQHGFAYLMNGRAQDALPLLEQARALWPDSAATYRWLAEAYTAVGRSEDAITNYRLLFYGWPGRTIPSLDWEALGQASVRPSDEPSDYKQPNPEETDPILLLQFSLLLQQTNQIDEAKAIYNRAMSIRTAEHSSSGQPDTKPLPPATSDALAPPDLQAATLTQLAIYRLTADRNDAEDELSAALLWKPKDTVASYYMAKVVQEQENAQTMRHHL